MHASTPPLSHIQPSAWKLKMTKKIATLHGCVLSLTLSLSLSLTHTHTQKQNAVKDLRTKNLFQQSVHKLIKSNVSVFFTWIDVNNNIYHEDNIKSRKLSKIFWKRHSRHYKTTSNNYSKLITQGSKNLISSNNLIHLIKRCKIVWIFFISFWEKE
jgi:hypothetical protein